MVISQFYPIVGGAERQVQLLAKHLVAKGIEVRIVTGWWKYGTPSEEIIGGVRVHRNFTFWGLDLAKKVAILRYFAGITYALTLAGYLVTEGKKFDLIHIHQAIYPAFVSVLFGKSVLKKPTLVKTASSGLTSDIRQIKRVPFGSLQLKYLVKHMDVLVSVSRTGAEEFMKIGFPESKIAYIPNGVTFPDLLKKDRDEVRQVITVSRLSYEKGIDVLLEAWGKVIRCQNTLELVIVGTGPLESRLKQLCESIGIARSVEFTGLVSNVDEYLERADLFVLPSRAEGLSNALLEAMSYSLPCIATRVGGTPEVIKEGERGNVGKGEFTLGDNGILVNPDDSEALSEAILYLFKNRDQRKAMARRGRELIRKKYSIDSIGNEYISLYQQLLDKGAA